MCGHARKGRHSGDVINELVEVALHMRRMMENIDKPPIAVFLIDGARNPDGLVGGAEMQIAADPCSNIKTQLA